VKKKSVVVVELSVGRKAERKQAMIPLHLQRRRQCEVRKRNDLDLMCHQCLDAYPLVQSRRVIIAREGLIQLANLKKAPIGTKRGAVTVLDPLLQLETASKAFSDKTARHAVF
jgi:hypothetical protein